MQVSSEFLTFVIIFTKIILYSCLKRQIFLFFRSNLSILEVGNLKLCCFYPTCIQRLLFFCIIISFIFAAGSHVSVSKITLFSWEENPNIYVLCLSPSCFTLIHFNLYQFHEYVLYDVCRYIFDSNDITFLINQWD